MHPILIALIAVISTVTVLWLVCLSAVIVIYKKMFGYRFSHDPLVTTYTPEGLNLESVPFETELEGETIRGGIYTERGVAPDGDTLVVLCHGMWGSHRSYMQEIGYLCHGGFRVLSFDYIGTSLSDGKTLGGFGQSLRCLDRVLCHVKATEGLSDNKIVVFGHSWGGYAATNIVRLHPDVTGVVAIAPATSFDAVAANVLPRGLGFLIPTVKLVDKANMGKYANRTAVKSLADYKGKALFIHSTDDYMCPFETTTGAVRAKYGDRFEYIVMSDKGHNPQYTYEGLALMRDYSKAMKSLATEEEKNEYKRNADFLAMGALDSSVMDGVVGKIKEWVE